MKSFILQIRGKQYSRSVEMLGDVEKVRWYEMKIVGFNEIYDQSELLRLEDFYELGCQTDITPPIFFI